MILTRECLGFDLTPSDTNANLRIQSLRRLGERRNITIDPDGQCRSGRLQLAITALNLALVEVVEIQRLGQLEDVLVPIIDDKACLDHLNGGMAADIT